jgi:glycerol-3-phosphate acyltransferase PlsX
MRIGVDAMGGDFAPETTVKGAIKAIAEFPENSSIILYGDQSQIKTILKKEKVTSDKIEIIHTSQIIGMGDHPVKTFTRNPDSSIAVGFKHLAQKKIDGFGSAGNTGAMLVGAMHTVQQIPGIIRPCITGPLPKLDGGTTILLDVGINPDCKPDVLYQYAILGSLYAEHVHNIKKPRVALLNIGEEEEKGNLLTSATHKLMKDSKDFNFIGNIEGNKLFYNDIADVVVTDGFSGNVVLKEAEAFYTLIKKRGLSDEYFDRFNPDIYGGTPILGVNSTVVIGHGASNDIAIKNMILHTLHVAEAKLSEKIKEALKHVEN